MSTPVPHRSFAPATLLAVLLALLMLLPFSTTAGPLDPLTPKIQLDLGSHGDSGDGEQGDELAPAPGAQVGNTRLAPRAAGDQLAPRAAAHRYQPIRAPPQRG